MPERTPAVKGRLSKIGYQRSSADRRRVRGRIGRSRPPSRCGRDPSIPSACSAGLRTCRAGSGEVACAAGFRSGRGSSRRRLASVRVGPRSIGSSEAIRRCRGGPGRIGSRIAVRPARARSRVPSAAARPFGRLAVADVRPWIGPFSGRPVGESSRTLKTGGVSDMLAVPPVPARRIASAGGGAYPYRKQ